MNNFLFIMLLAATTTTILQIPSVKSSFHDLFAPLGSLLPDGDNCKNVNCGNGTCVTTKKAPFVKCECKEGWKQPDLYHGFPFQPCVVPNCTIDYACSGGSGHFSPATARFPFLPKISNPLNPCSYNVCGAGNCVLKSNSSIEYQCECFQGYGNIMNLSWGFCSRECELQKDCSRLGVSVNGNIIDGDNCKNVNCGNGTCVTTKEAPFVKCECKEGWKQPDLPLDFPFQPCVVPNCTIDHACSGGSNHLSPAAAPFPSFPKISNPLNPCSYNVCGAGNCVLKSNSTIEYQCECFQGYGNIMNLTWGFCSRECELQKDCSRLGVSVSENATSTTNDSSTNDAQGGLTFKKENSHLVTGLILATLIMLFG